MRVISVLALLSAAAIASASPSPKGLVIANDETAEVGGGERISRQNFEVDCPKGYIRIDTKCCKIVEDVGFDCSQTIG